MDLHRARGLFRPPGPISVSKVPLRQTSLEARLGFPFTYVYACICKNRNRDTEKDIDIVFYGYDTHVEYGYDSDYRADGR